MSRSPACCCSWPCPFHVPARRPSAVVIAAKACAPCASSSSHPRPAPQVGGDYGLLNKTTFQPNPDYWAALVWHQVLGGAAYNTVPAGGGAATDAVRAFTQCSSSDNSVGRSTQRGVGRGGNVGSPPPPHLLTPSGLTQLPSVLPSARHQTLVLIVLNFALSTRTASPGSLAVSFDSGRPLPSQAHMWQVSDRRAPVWAELAAFHMPAPFSRPRAPAC